MKKKRVMIVVAVVFAILVVIGALIGYFVSRDVKQEQILRNEINVLNKLDIKKDSYDTKIKTTGDYAVVEKTIKEYLNDYATNLQDVLAILQDEKLSSVLSAENYKNDGPDFVSTKEYLETTKKDFNEKLTKLTNMTDNKVIMKKIKNKNLNSYYVDLYEELMLRGIAREDLQESKTDLKKAGETINNLLEVEQNVINLLVENKDKWSVENDTIVFKDTDTLNKYNELIKNYTSREN